MRKMLFAGVALLAFASPGHARSMSYVCDGTVGVYPLSAYTAIDGGKSNDNMCVFITNSAEGRRILRTCPRGSQCSVEATVDNTAVAYEIYKVTSVRRMDAASATGRRPCVVSDPTGTPLNVRSRPNGPILGALLNDTEVFISDMTVAGGRKWAKVVPVGEGKSGWVFHDFLSCGT